ncbi:MAG: sugar transporter [Alcaligenaceae bacterium]|nr:MAG: sugar transporter [Alcaligenaceae bacterium]
MKQLLVAVGWVDRLTDFFAVLAKWAVLMCACLSAGNAIMRYAFSYSSNAWLEIQWYLFAACVMLGAAQVLRVNEHVRVDVIYGALKARSRAYIDLFGLLFFLMPAMSLFLYLSWPLFVQMLLSGEGSPNAGGLIRWPAMLTLPLGFSLMVLQGIAEIIKRVAWLNNAYQMDMHYERPLQ